VLSECEFSFSSIFALPSYFGGVAVQVKPVVAVADKNSFFA